MRPRNSSVGRLRGAGLVAALLAAGLMLASCLPGGRAAEPSGAAPGGAPAAGPKVLRVGMTSAKWPKDGLIPFKSAGSTGDPEYAFTFHAGLTAYDPQSALVPRVAQKVPMIRDGDWKVFPDGQMEITWKMNSNAKWHDGVAATAEDFAFGLKVVQDPEFPLTRSDAARLVSEVVTPDASTLVIRWKQTHIYGNVSGPETIPALPLHLMGELYEGGDKQAFFNSPLWTNQFVGLGPYRLGEWVEGSRLEGLASEDYVLGRPKIDRVIFQYFGDANVLLLSLLSGAADMTLTGNFEIPTLILVKNAWDPAGDGTAFAIASRTRIYTFQFRNADAPWARDVRVRRALAHMLDRQALVDSLMGGLVGVADTIVPARDPVHRLLEQRGLARYPFDLDQAERLMADAGWTRAPGGAYRSSTGEPFTIDIAFSNYLANITEAEAVAGQWKAAGLADVVLGPIPITAPTAVRQEGYHSGKGVDAHPVGADLVSIGGFTTAQIGTPANRYTTLNRGGYSNPAYDRLYDRASITLDEGQREGLMADMLKLLADDVAMIPGFYDSSTATGAFRKGIRGPGMTSGLQLAVAWNINDWEMD